MTTLSVLLPLVIGTLSAVPYLLEILSSGIVIVVGYILNRFLIQRIIRKFGETADLDLHHIQPFNRIASILLWIIVVFIILGIFGLREFLWGLLATAGFTGIVIGMATRDIVSDMLTGFLLYFYRPFKIGDSVEISDIWGKVKDIGFSGVKIAAWSGETVIIPNSKIRTSIIKNYEIDQRRATITFYVDYTSDFAKTLLLCKQVLDKTPEVLKDPKPVIRVDDFTERSIKILLLVWFSIDDYWNGLEKVNNLLAEAFQTRGLKGPILRSEEPTQGFQ
jgi:small conductance mechanosensitive channel